MTQEQKALIEEAQEVLRRWEEQEHANLPTRIAHASRVITRLSSALQSAIDGREEAAGTEGPQE